MEVNLQQRRKGLEVKIPDIQQTLTVVQFLQNRRLKAKGEKVEEEELSDDEDDLDDDLEDDEGKKEEPLKTLFELNDTLFAEAEVEETGEVGIWLGVSRLLSILLSYLAQRKDRANEKANTMLMYPLEEAITLLSGKLVAAKRNLEETIEDLEWLREQSTVMEVNFARVHNVRFPPLLLPSRFSLPLSYRTLDNQ
jgi:hypothetical protein